MNFVDSGFEVLCKQKPGMGLLAEACSYSRELEKLLYQNSRSDFGSAAAGRSLARVALFVAGRELELLVC